MRERHADSFGVSFRLVPVVILALLVPLLGTPASADAPAPVPAPAVSASPAPPPEVLPPRPTPVTPEFPAWIDAPAGYDGQTTCLPSAQPGAVGLADLIRATYPAITTIGITRACGQGGTSEHKEGRALDVMLDATTLEGRAVAAAFLGWLTATDQYGNTAAMARRLGVMYVIWNRQIWRAYNPSIGWAAYTGTEAHTDHIHISLSWAGAEKRTTWWSLDPMTTPGQHLIDGTWWRVQCAYPTPQQTRCTEDVRGGAATYSLALKHYVVRNAWTRRRTTVLDALSPAWDASPLTHTGEFTAPNGRRWRVTCTAEAPAPRTCDAAIWATVVTPVAGAVGTQTLSGRVTRTPQFVVTTELRLQ